MKKVGGFVAFRNFVCFGDLFGWLHVVEMKSDMQRLKFNPFPNRLNNRKDNKL